VERSGSNARALGAVLYGIAAPQAIGTLGWVFFGLQIVGIALSWRYFVLPPTIFCECWRSLLDGPRGWLAEGDKCKAEP